MSDQTKKRNGKPAGKSQQKPANQTAEARQSGKHAKDASSTRRTGSTSSKRARDIEKPDTHLEHEDQVVSFRSSSAERFFDGFARSTRRWELFVYPTLIVLLLAWGLVFYLIYGVARDMGRIALLFDPKVSTDISRLAENMEDLTHSIRAIHKEVQTMTSHIKIMSSKMDHLEKMTPMNVNLEKMNQSVAIMNHSVRTITANMDRMRWDMTSMNRNISKPMSFMNSFMPW